MSTSHAWSVPMELHAWMHRVHLELEGGHLHGLLLIARQPGEAGGEGVRDSELHQSTRNTFMTSSPRWLMTFTAIRPEVGVSNGRERSRVQRFPGFLVDLSLEARFQGLVGIIGSKEVRVADEEALLVVIGVDEPAGDPLGPRRCGLRPYWGGTRPPR